MKELNIDKALVVGLGARTGLFASNFLARMGVSTTVNDIKDRDELKDIIKKLNSKVKVSVGGQSPELLDEGFDIIILSPGVPKSIPLIREAYGRGIPVISEIELSYNYLKGLVIAITGTDGKSTTTELTGHILNRLGINTFVGGNIGIPLISLVDKTKDDSVTVIELSSFQLETIKDFKPHISAIMNITPDHLDRYEGMDDYAETKFRIAMNQQKEDSFIYNKDDMLVEKSLESVKSRKHSFSLIDKSSDIFYENGYICMGESCKDTRIIDVSKMQILGLHNVQNVMASVLIVMSILWMKKIEPKIESIAEAIYSFQGLEHRMEKIGIYEGRIFINDSKATTVGAVEMAMKSILGKGILIIGGRKKGGDYGSLSNVLREKARSLVLIGESREYFSDIFADFKLSQADSLDDAIVKAMKVSEKGDTIILSPACASFDMFTDYEERGRVFKESFSKLKNGELIWT
ncbi:UDP-N-acetylmuramoyl-L-alanine--D-glutamate ligase [Spirochaetota bacterium]